MLRILQKGGHIMARKIPVKLILELRAAKLSMRKIAAIRRISRHSVSEVFRIANERDIAYQDVKDMGDEELYQLFFPEKHFIETMFEEPDYAKIHQELKKVGVTLKLLWEEYTEACQVKGAISRGYSTFCEGYRDFTIAHQLTNHLDHKPGERVEVDWSGKTMWYTDISTGEIVEVFLFVATLPYSQYSYVEPTHDMKMESFLRCHIHMYEYFGGVPTRTICDNLKTGVVRHPKAGEVVLTEDYAALGSHYMTAIMPTGIRKPKQKASVEGTVGKIATAVIAKLRDKQFYSLPELKRAVAKEMDNFNHQRFQKREGSRYESWLEEKPYLQALPALPYEISHWENARAVNIDFHVIYKKNRYSCPYQYAGKKVDLRITDSTLEIYHKGQRLTTHGLFPAHVKNRYSTHQEDMPPAFRKIVPWDDTRIRKWAAAIGPNISEVIERIFRSVQIKEQAYNPSLAVLKLSKTYTEERLENAAELVLKRGARNPRYHHLSSILSANQDILYAQQKNEPPNPEEASMGYLRGTAYYEKGGHEDA